LKRYTKTEKRDIVKSEDAELVAATDERSACCGAWMVFLIAVAFVRAGDKPELKPEGFVPGNIYSVPN
jgi:hypothetical protein